LRSWSRRSRSIQAIRSSWSLCLSICMRYKGSKRAFFYDYVFNYFW
jgi:hypothetical protein